MFWFKSPQRKIDLLKKEIKFLEFERPKLKKSVRDKKRSLKTKGNRLTSELRDKLLYEISSENSEIIKMKKQIKSKEKKIKRLQKKL